jgi:hypothetical protein
VTKNIRSMRRKARYGFQINPMSGKTKPSTMLKRITDGVKN